MQPCPLTLNFPLIERCRQDVLEIRIKLHELYAFFIAEPHVGQSPMADHASCQRANLGELNFHVHGDNLISLGRYIALVNNPGLFGNFTVVCL
jgi:hypothetical protein